ELPTASDLLRTLDTLVLHLSAFAGMQAENMTRGQGWRFLEVGRRIERALSGLKLLRTAAGQGDESSLLDPLLETCDSVMTYRRRHFSRPRLEPVIELIFFDRTNPRSVAYQVEIIGKEITRFPGEQDFGLLPKIREHLQELETRFTNDRPPDEDGFEDTVTDIEVFADMLTQHYFSHSVRRVY
ncbi:MAG: alpha-E domain-containing protein, partial [Verrucomicrobiaceae bacterium]